MNHADFLDQLKRLAASDWPLLWAAVYAHREACIEDLGAGSRGRRWESVGRRARARCGG